MWILPTAHREPLPSPGRTQQASTWQPAVWALHSATLDHHILTLNTTLSLRIFKTQLGFIASIRCYSYQKLQRGEGKMQKAKNRTATAGWNDLQHNHQPVSLSEQLVESGSWAQLWHPLVDIFLYGSQWGQELPLETEEMFTTNNLVAVFLKASRQNGPWVQFLYSSGKWRNIGVLIHTHMQWTRHAALLLLLLYYLLLHNPAWTQIRM